jgi:hypothetical protein
MSVIHNDCKLSSITGALCSVPIRGARLIVQTSEAPKIVNLVVITAKPVRESSSAPRKKGT